MKRVIVIEGNDADVESWVLGTLESLDSLTVYLRDSLGDAVGARSWTSARSLLAQLERVSQHRMLLVRADTEDRLAAVMADLEDDEPLRVEDLHYPEDDAPMPVIAERTYPEDED